MIAEHRDPGPDGHGRPVLAIRGLLNGWDPIGVMDHGGPADEYDCLIAPLIDRLAAGDRVDALAAFLRAELVGHFGLDGEWHATSAARVAGDLVALWDRGG